MMVDGKVCVIIPGSHTGIPLPELTAEVTLFLGACKLRPTLHQMLNSCSSSIGGQVPSATVNALY